MLLFDRKLNVEDEFAYGSIAIKWQGGDLNSGQPTPAFTVVLRVQLSAKAKLDVRTETK